MVTDQISDVLYAGLNTIWVWKYLMINTWPSGLCLGLHGWAGTRTNLDFTEAKESEWHWHQLGDMQICTLLQTDIMQICTLPQIDKHTSFPPLSFCRPDALPATQPDTHTQSFYGSSGICLGLPRWAGTRKVKPGRVKPIWVYWSKR